MDTVNRHHLGLGPGLCFALALAAAPRFAVAEGVFSPGELNQAHAALDALDSCQRCHGAKGGTSPSKCLSCHNDLAKRIQKKQGYHGRSVERRAACSSCHTEHQGRSGSLIPWPGGSQAKFPHSDAGYPLEAGHRLRWVPRRCAPRQGRQRLRGVPHGQRL